MLASALAQDFDPAMRLGGLLFNKVGGEAHTKWLSDAIASAGLSLPVLGGIPKVRPSFLHYPVRWVVKLLKKPAGVRCGCGGAACL